MGNIYPPHETTPPLLNIDPVDLKPGAKDNMFDRRPHLGLPSWFKR